MDVFLTILFPLIFIINGLFIGKIFSYYKSWSFLNNSLLGTLVFIAYLAFISIIFSVIPYASIETYRYLLLSFQLLLVVYYIFNAKILVNINIKYFNFKNLFLFLIFFFVFLLISNLFLTYNYSQLLVSSQDLLNLSLKVTPYFYGFKFPLNAYHTTQIFMYHLVSKSQYNFFVKYSFNILICYLFSLIFTSVFNKKNETKFNISDLYKLCFYLVFILLINTITYSLTNNSVSAFAWISLYLFLSAYALDCLENDHVFARYIIFAIFISSAFFIKWFYFIEIAIFVILIPILRYKTSFNSFKFLTYFFSFIVFDILLSFLNINNISVDVAIFLIVVNSIFLILIT